MKKFQLVENHEGENYDYTQNHIYVKVSSRDTNGGFWMAEDTLAAEFDIYNL